MEIEWRKVDAQVYSTCDREVSIADIHKVVPVRLALFVNNQNKLMALWARIVRRLAAVFRKTGFVGKQ